MTRKTGLNITRVWFIRCEECRNSNAASGILKKEFDRQMRESGWKVLGKRTLCGVCAPVPYRTKD